MVNMRRFAVATLVLLASAASSTASTITLTGTIRDFKRTDLPGGHPDFENLIVADPGIVQTTLGADGKPVYAGAAGNPSTHGQTAFDQWYRDTPGVNLSSQYPITLNDDGAAGDGTANDGVFTYQNFEFFPIDGALFGNQGLSHNYHFTYELHTQFTFVPTQTFSYFADDDLWVFINNQLVLDLGGVHPFMFGTVNLNTLGLTPGNVYNLDMFYAERHTLWANLMVMTNIPLQALPEPTSAVPEPATLLLIGTGAIGWLARRRQ
jgi:fibro-slime domain-containing protein